jgi:hypothetical protein
MAAYFDGRFSSNLALGSEDVASAQNHLAQLKKDAAPKDRNWLKSFELILQNY